jgi:hypothetical protein
LFLEKKTEKIRNVEIKSTTIKDLYLEEFLEDFQIFKEKASHKLRFTERERKKEINHKKMINNRQT